MGILEEGGLELRQSMLWKANKEILHAEEGAMYI